MKASIKLLGTGSAALLLVLASAFTAQAGEQASGTAKLPYLSGGKVYAEANLNGPNPVGTKLCVYLNALYPYGPDVNLASKCATINAGTVKVGINKPTCASVTTWAVATYNGKSTWEGSSKYAVFC
ncbi:hypothetical protein [Streptomyces sp. NPDC048496]|uniref:hypothetical protein n=1 Tax=Streptomyces sp. NPDC048496 TaxID=3365558 RepID=UPI003718C620